jgi:hypothetical protein
MTAPQRRSGLLGRTLACTSAFVILAMLSSTKEAAAQFGSNREMSLGSGMDMSFEFNSILEDVMGSAEGDNRNNRNRGGRNQQGGDNILSRGGASEGVFGGGRNTRETVRSSISELRPQDIVSETRTPTVNRRRQEAVDRSTGMYAPRLRLSPELSRAAEQANAMGVRNGDPKRWDHLAERLERRFYSNPAALNPDPGPDRIQLAYEEGTAILKGKVQEPRQKEIAELVVMMEPGVRRVRNLLQVASETIETNPATAP